MAIGKRPPQIFGRLRGSCVRHPGLIFPPSIRHDILFPRRKWRNMTKNQENRQNTCFWYSYCKCLFVKSDENVTKTVSFCVFAVFFLTIRLTSIGKSSFVRCTKLLGCLHFGRFEAINSWIYIVSVASLYWEMIFWTNVSFHCFQYARYVFDDTITKMSGFC